MLGLLALLLLTGAQAELPSHVVRKHAGHFSKLDDISLAPGLTRRHLQASAKSCGTASGFTFYKGKDVTTTPTSNCDTVGSSTLADLAKECAEDRDCRSFSVYKSSKGTDSYCTNYVNGPLADESTSYMKGKCYGTYVQNCPTVPAGYTFYKDRDLHGKAIGCYFRRNRTIEDIKLACQEEKGCRSFTTYLDSTDNSESYCLYSQVGWLNTMTAVPGKCYGSYISGPAPPPLPAKHLTQWGGPIMAKTVHVFMIYVGGYKSTDLLPSTITHFVSNLADSDWWRLNKRSYMDPPHVPKRTYANGLIKLAGSYYIELNANMGLTKKSTARDVARTIQYVVGKKQVPWDPEQGIYVVVSKPGQYTLTDCGGGGYCGYHDSWSRWENDQWSKMKFAFIPEGGCSNGCDMTTDLVDEAYTMDTSPSGSGRVDAIIKTLAHELTETTTDPRIDAYMDIYGYENADLCSWRFGTLNTHTYPSGKKVVYNAVVGGKPYIMQLNWDPAVNPKTKQQYGCVYGVSKSGASLTLNGKAPSLTA